MRDENWTINKISLGFKIFAWTSAAIGLFVSVLILIFGGTPETPRPLSIVGLAFGFFYFVFFYAVAEVMNLLIRIEKNTRRD